MLLCNLIITVVLLVASTRGTSNRDIFLQCQSDHGEPDDVSWTGCNITNLNITDGVPIPKLRFPSQREIIIMESTIAYLSPDLLNLSNETTILRVEEGHVPKVYLKPTLEEFLVLDSDTEELVIDEKDNFVTYMLEVSVNLLTEVPSNVNRLKNLTKLYLCGNLIETVHLDQFSGLDQLRQLFLDSNRISSIVVANEVAHLPQLRAFSAGGNVIKSVDVRRWSMDMLATLNLRRNNLRFIVGLEGRFKQLTQLPLRGNVVNCRWMQDVEEMLRNQTNAGMRIERNLCWDHVANELCCEGDETDASYLEYQRTNAGKPIADIK